MPIMTHSACHSEMTVSMTDSDTSFNNRRDFRSQRGSRYVTMRERRKHMANSVAGNGTPQPTRSPDDCVDEKVTALLPESESCAPLSSSGSAVSRFVGRLGASVRSLSSLRTVPSWRSSLFPDVHTTYAQIEPRYDSEDSDSTNPPHLSHGMTPDQHHLSGGQRYDTLRRRRHERRTRSSNNVLHAAISLPSVPGCFPHAKTTSNKRHDPDSSSGSSLSIYQPYFDGRVPFPSISEESYPSPHSPDAIEVFQIPSDNGKVRPFDCFAKHRDIFEDEIQVIFEEASDGTSTNLSTGAASVCPISGRHSLLAPLRRRVSAVASSVIHIRRKFPTKFRKNRSSNPADDDDDEPVDYGIPCLAYITCLW